MGSRKLLRIMKQRFLWILLLMCGGILAHSQNYNQERTALANFLVRMYENAPFDGVKAVEDYENAYLMSVVILDKSKYKSESTLNRVASVKAMSQASRFFNGSNITAWLSVRQRNPMVHPTLKSSRTYVKIQSDTSGSSNSSPTSSLPMAGKCSSS